MATKTFSDLFKEAASKDAYWVEKTILEFTSDLYTEMKRQGKSKSDLAAILGTSQAYITKVFSGSANFTIESMVKLSRALGCRLHLKISPQENHVCWVHVPIKRDATMVATTAAASDSYSRKGLSYADSAIAA